MQNRYGMLMVLTAALLPMATLAQVEGPRPTEVLIRAEGKGNSRPPRLQASDVKLQVGGQQIPLTALRPLTGQGSGQQVEVALLIDDGLRGNFGTELGDIERFVKSSVGPNVQIGVGYMRNGGAEFVNGFSNDPEVAARSIRIPIGGGGVSGSPYFVVSDLVKHWPTHSNAAHVVLMITNGIDYYNGSVSPLNQDSPYVNQTITDAQRAGVPVYSIYYGRRAVNSGAGSFSGQSYLSKVAQETGGISFANGTINPVSLQPFFNDFNRALAQTYAASFPLAARRLERLRVSTSVPDVKLRAAAQVQAAVNVVAKSSER